MKALFIVDKDFRHIHVGVRRVTMYYAKKLLQQGCTVSFGFFEGQRLLAVPGEKLNMSLIKDIRHESESPPSYSNTPIPSWCSSNALSASQALHDQKHVKTLNQQVMATVTDKIVDESVSDHELTADDFDVTYISAPWVIHSQTPKLRNVVGIVLDIVPNLIALGVLRFDHYLEVSEFAHQHDQGFQYYIKHAKKILCISHYTQQDFSKFYRVVGDRRVTFDIPFEFGSHDSAKKKP